MVCTGARQVHQAQQVRHGAARTADRRGRLLVGEAEIGDQALDALRLFQRIQVFALDVLDQRHRGGGLVVHVAHQHRNLLQAGQLRGAEAAFAGDDLVLGGAGQLSLPTGRTSTGCMMPWVLMDAASSASAPSSMRVRGWYLPACSWVTGSEDGVPGSGWGALAVAAQQCFEAAAEALEFFGCHDWSASRSDYIVLMRLTISAPKAM